MPHASSHLDALTSDLPTHSSDDLVESNIALQPVRPRDIGCTRSLADAKEPGTRPMCPGNPLGDHGQRAIASSASASATRSRSEEHTSELQSPDHLVCRPLLEKKK